MSETIAPNLKLHLRFPVRIPDELTVRALSSEIERVWLPRQKSTRWAIVGFRTAESLRIARETIKSKRLEGKRIAVKGFKPKPSKKRRAALVRRKQREFSAPVVSEAVIEVLK